MKATFQPRFTSQPGGAAIQNRLTQILATPWRQLTGGQRCLRLLLQANPSLINRLQYQEKGNYYWITLSNAAFVEIVLCCWLPQSTSDRHDHYSSWNLTVVLLGTLVAKLFHISRSSFFIYQQSDVKELGIITTPRWQTHAIENPFDSIAISLHFYTSHRPNLFLEVDD